MRGIDRERREHREDPRLEHARELAALGGLELLEAAQADPEVAQPREQILAQDLVLARDCSITSGPDRASCSDGERPSIERAPTSAAICVLRPATRTWKKWSRLRLAIARNFTRSSTGSVSSSASAITRALKSSQVSSRLK
jgi:hypothetical protein